MAKNSKKITAGSVIRTLILLIAIGVFCFSAYKLYTIWQGYKTGEDEYEELQQYVTTEEDTDVKGQGRPEDADLNEVNYPAKPSVDFEALKAINPDIIGWIDMRGIDISYPITQGTDNSYYLHRTFENTSNFAGSIFMDFANTSDFTDCNSLIYGHNMKNQSMFGKLKQYKEQDTYEANPYFWICTPQGDYLYEIFSVHDTPADSEVYTFFSGAGTEFDDWCIKMKQESVVTTSAEASGEDKVITLSTCTSDDAVRCVVQAKQISGE